MVGVEDAGPGHAGRLVLDRFFGRCGIRVRIGLAWRSCLLGKLPTVLVPLSASRDLKAVVCRRRWLAIVLPLHRPGELLRFAT